MHAWHWVDYAIIGIVGLSIVTGLFRGFVKELIALGVWVLAIWLALTYSHHVAVWLQPYIGDQMARSVVAFVAILVMTVIAGSIVNAMLSFILHRSGLSGTDRLLGMGFGFVRGVFIVAVLMLVVKMTSIPYQEYSNQSILYAKFDPLVNALYGYTPELIRHMKVFENNTLMPENKLTH